MRDRPREQRLLDRSFSGAAPGRAAVFRTRVHGVGPIGVEVKERVDKALGMRRFTDVATAGLFLVVLVGSLDTFTNSATGCGALWLLCHGGIVPQATLQPWVEYGHRAVTNIEGILVVLVTILAWKGIAFWGPGSSRPSASAWSWGKPLWGRSEWFIRRRCPSWPRTSPSPCSRFRASRS